MIAALRAAVVALSCFVAASAGANDAALPVVSDTAYGVALIEMRDMAGVRDVAFLPDGDRLVTVGDDGFIRLWDVDTGAQVAQFGGDDGSLVTVDVSADGTRIVTGSWTGTVRLWDVQAGFEITRFETSGSSLWGIALSSDGLRIATAGYGGSQLWDAATGIEIIRLWDDRARDYGHSVAFSQAGDLLAYGGMLGALRLLDTETGAEVALIEGSERQIFSCAFSPDGRRLAAGQGDGTVVIWNVETTAEILRLRGHDNWIRGVAFSPDGERIATASYDGTAKIWDVATGAEIARLDGHWGRIGSVVFSPDGSRLVTGIRDDTARVWDAASGAEIAILHTHQHDTLSAILPPSGMRVLTTSYDSTVKLWDPESGEVVALQGHEGEIVSAAFSADHTRIVTTSRDNTARAWDAAGGIEIATLRGHTETVLSAAFSADGTRIVTTSRDETARVWDATSGIEIATLQGEGRDVISAAFSPSGMRIATAFSDSSVRIWDGVRGAVIRTLRGHEDDVTSVAFSPDGTRIATGAGDDTARLWDAETDNEIRQFVGHESSVRTVEFSPDGSRLATGGYDATVRLWDMATGEEVGQFVGHRAAVRTVAFSPDSMRLVTTSDDGTARVWDIESGQQVEVFAGGHGGRWHSCSFPEDRCRRWDDGRLAYHIDNGQVIPLHPPAPVEPARIRLTAPPQPRHLEDGEALDLNLSVQNSGGAAYGVQILSADPSEPVPENPSVFVGILDPQVLVEGAGAVTDVPVRLIARTAQENPRGGEVAVPLRLLHAHGEAPLQAPGAQADDVTLRITVAAPELQLASVDLQEPVESGRPYTAVVQLQNIGADHSGAIEARLALQGPADEEEPIVVRSDQPAPSDSIAPGTPRDLSFSLPPDAFADGVPRPLQASLSIVTTDHLANDDVVFHRWQLTADVTLPTPPWVYVAAVSAVVVALAVATWIIGAPRVPAVARLSGAPDALFRERVETLPRLQSLLFYAGRRRDVLEAAKVPVRRFERVATFPTVDSVERIEILAQRLHLRTSPVREQPDGIAVHVAETPDQLMLNLPKLRVVAPDPELSGEQVLERFSQTKGDGDLLAFFISANAEQREDLARRLEGSGRFAAVATGEELTRILLGDAPLDDFAAVISRQVRATRISAYQRGGGVSRAAAFFGRDGELSQVLNRDPANYFLVGARQVGKSSFLKEVERRAEAEGRVQAHYCTLVDETLGGPLAEALRLDSRALEPALDALGAPGAPVRLVLIDEADRFVAADTDADYPVLRRLRRLSEEGRAFFIIAGFWSLYRSIGFDFHSPLRNFGELIVLEDLEPDASRRLITKPMAALGLSYASDDDIDTIRTKTGGRANLMAIACDTILKGLRPEVRIIGADSVASALASDAILSALQGWQSLSGESKPRANCIDQIVVFATASTESFDVPELQRILQGVNISISAADLQESLARLEIGFILKRHADRRYRYRVPLLVDLIREFDLETELRALAARTSQA